MRASTMSARDRHRAGEMRGAVQALGSDARRAMRWHRIRAANRVLNDRFARDGRLTCDSCGLTPLIIVSWDDCASLNHRRRAHVHIEPGLPELTDRTHRVTCTPCAAASARQADLASPPAPRAPTISPP